MRVTQGIIKTYTLFLLAPFFDSARLDQSNRGHAPVPFTVWAQKCFPYYYILGQEKHGIANYDCLYDQVRESTSAAILSLYGTYPLFTDIFSHTSCF